MEVAVGVEVPPAAAHDGADALQVLLRAALRGEPGGQEVQALADLLGGLDPVGVDGDRDGRLDVLFALAERRVTALLADIDHALLDTWHADDRASTGRRGTP
ncbi:MULTISPECIES: hypothetical protein [unclassified Streptomyces]|uniref:hypothetical protein n=1 Tax=unclassified Streptomyces TaxID=2593676 RepID=UPI0036FB8691